VTGTLAVADLDGFAENDNKRHWRATARTQVRDTDGNPVANAVVYGNWRSSRVGTGTTTTISPTDADGWVEHRFIRLSDSSSPVTYTIDRVEHADYTYEPLLNSDPDGDSVISESGAISISISRSMAAGTIRFAAPAASTTQHDSATQTLASASSISLAEPRSRIENARSAAAAQASLHARLQGWTPDATSPDRLVAANRETAPTTMQPKRRSAAIDQSFADTSDWILPQLSNALLSDLRV
jgi:hypothetical protein